MGRTRPPNKLTNCVVCGLSGHGNNFGVFTCLACAAFFRKSFVEGREYECKREGKCVIWEDSRNICRHCRLNKCLQMGMNKNLVQNQYTKCGINEKMKKKEETRKINKITNQLKKLSNEIKKEKIIKRKNKNGEINIDEENQIKMPLESMMMTPAETVDMENDDDINGEDTENDSNDGDDKPLEEIPATLALLRAIECRLRQMRANKNWIYALELEKGNNSSMDQLLMIEAEEKQQRFLVPELDRLLFRGNLLQQINLFINASQTDREISSTDFWYFEKMLCHAVFKSMPWYGQLCDCDKRILLDHVERQAAVMISIYYSVLEGKPQMVWFNGKSLEQSLWEKCGQNESFKSISSRIVDSIAKLHTQMKNSHQQMSENEFALLLAIIFAQHNGIHLSNSGSQLLRQESTNLHNILGEIYNQKYGQNGHPMAQREFMDMMMSSHEIGTQLEQFEILMDLFNLKSMESSKNDQILSESIIIENPHNSFDCNLEKTQNQQYDNCFFPSPNKSQQTITNWTLPLEHWEMMPMTSTQNNNNYIPLTYPLNDEDDEINLMSL